MENTNIVIADERMAQIVKGTLGVELNYQPFSSWYGSVLEKMETSNEITENIFFQALEHIGAISRVNGQTLPPLAIYDRMRGTDGEPKITWYCKKFSSVKNDYVESYGICLNEVEEFENRYLKEILSILTYIEIEVTTEKEIADEWKKSAKEKAGRGKYKRITAQAKSMVREAKDFIVREAFKVGE